MLDVRCTRCDRAGRLSMARLLAERWLAPSRLEQDRLERHQTGRELATQNLGCSTDDLVGISAATRPDLLDQRVPINKTPRERRVVGHLLLERDDIDPDVREGRVDQ